jgi:two-component system sensor histidine kinase YesM
MLIFRKKIFSKLLVSFVAVSIPMLIFVGFISFSYSSKAINDQLDKQAEMVMEQKLNALTLFFEDLRRMEYIISINRDFSRFLSFTGNDDQYYRFFVELDPIVNALETIRPETVGITVINAKNQVYFYGYTYNHEAGSFSDWPWMPDHTELDGKPFLSVPHDRPYSLRDQNRQVFSYVQRFWSLSSNAEGLLIFDFPVDVLGQLLAQDAHPLDSGTLVIDQDNRLIYPSESAVFAKTDSFAELAPHIVASDGKTYRMFYKTDPFSGWTIASYFSEKSLYQTIAQYRNVLIGFLLASVVICLIASLILSFRIAHPIMTLVRLMKDVKRGDLDQQIVVKQRDEIGQLGIEFNRMIRHIQNLIAKVYEQEKEKRAVEISALQAQINPHFLYNTLEAINSLARMNKQHDISKQIALLGKLLRFSIATFKEFVPFEKELQYVEQYLLINKLRMKDNEFDFSLRFDEELIQLYTIKWILQPIVENAILHGLEPAGRKGRIEIEGCTRGDDVLVTVRDNGVGIPAEKLQQIRYELEHHSETMTKYGNKVGLFNVQTRIRLHYGPTYGISIDSIPDEWTTVQVLIPRRSSDE